MKDWATIVMERCDLLGSISEEEGRLTRPYGSGAMRKANDVVAGWMQGAGTTVRRDAIRNLIGRYEGEGEGTLVLGSHLDTVRDAGKYDGTLGVLAALSCVEQLHARGERPPFSIEVVAFADEEGLRYRTTYLGSSVYAGSFDPALLEREDENGVSLADAVREFGGDTAGLAVGRGDEDLIGYCELHIEQGPVLENLGSPVGVVTGIAGQTRARVGFVGEAGHAGTVPMAGRRDAFCAAAEFALAAEQAARDEKEAVATVGEIEVHPGANNVIPGRAYLSLDLRHGKDAVREKLRDTLRERAEEIAAARGCEARWQVVQENGALPTDPELSVLLQRAASGPEGEQDVPRLPSGAGHDAAPLSGIAPIAMLFVRCKDGVSHNPAESVAKEDVAAALETMDRFIGLVGESRSKRESTAKEEIGG